MFFITSNVYKLESPSLLVLAGSPLFSYRYLCQSSNIFAYHYCFCYLNIWFFFHEFEKNLYSISKPQLMILQLHADIYKLVCAPNFGVVKYGIHIFRLLFLSLWITFQRNHERTSLELGVISVFCFKFC